MFCSVMFLRYQRQYQQIAAVPLNFAAKGTFRRWHFCGQLELPVPAYLARAYWSAVGLVHTTMLVPYLARAYCSAI